MTLDALYGVSTNLRLDRAREVSRARRASSGHHARAVEAGRRREPLPPRERRGREPVPRPARDRAVLVGARRRRARRRPRQEERDRLDPDHGRAARPRRPRGALARAARAGEGARRARSTGSSPTRSSWPSSDATPLRSCNLCALQAPGADLVSQLAPLFAALVRAGSDHEDWRTLTSTQRLLLFELAEAGPLRLGALAERVGATDPTTSRAVDGLVAAELVERRPDPADRRAVLHQVTPRGKARTEQRREELAAVLERALRGFLPAESQRLVELLEKLNEELAVGGIAARRAPGLLATRDGEALPPAPDARRRSRPRGLAYAVLSSSVIPALPTIQHDLHASETGVTWLLTGYLLSASVGDGDPRPPRRHVRQGARPPLDAGRLRRGDAARGGVALARRPDRRPRDPGRRRRDLPALVRDHPRRVPARAGAPAASAWSRRSSGSAPGRASSSAG